MFRAAWYGLKHAINRMWSRCFCLFAALALATVATAAEVTFNGQTISYTNAETNWVNGELVLIYTNTLTDGSLSLPAYTKARLLVVAGGGAGASPAGTGPRLAGAGGGGAGGLISTNAIFLKSGDYTLKVGAGGAAGSDSVVSIGANGGNSIVKFDSTELYKAVGGGGGGIRSVGSAGGCGGGGSAAFGGAGEEGQGCNGGSGLTSTGGTIPAAGAGGGGADSDGASPSGSGYGASRIGGVGGKGVENDITGETIVYAGGGGGGTYSGIGGAGGDGGGGNGASATENGAAGTDGLGGGGGGGSLNKAGGKGGDGVIIIRLQQVMPEKPTSGQTIPYDGEEHTILEENAAYTISEDSVVTASAIGTYTVKVSLNSGYCWADGSTDSVNFTWEIERLHLVVESLTVEGWQIGGVVSDPIIKSNVDQEKLSVTYKWTQNAKRGPWQPVDATSWSNIVSLLEQKGEGTYYVRATIVGTDEYIVDGGSVNVISAAFEIWNAPELNGMNLGYRLPIGGSGTVTLSLAENSPEGFSYSQVEANGADLRVIDANGNQLKCRVVSWNTSGTSQVVVEMGSVTSASLCWGLLVDADDSKLTIPDRSTSTATSTTSATLTPPARIVKDARFWNAWTKEPQWNDYATSAADMASARYGEVYYTVEGSGQTLTNQPPRRAGEYTIQFFVDAGSDNYKSWMGLKSDAITVSITPHSPYTDLKGTAESATQGGRVLLANDDTREPVVSGQSYDNTTTTASVYWEHTDELTFAITAPYLKTPRNHRLLSSAAVDELCGATTIWILQDVRIGNLYLSSLAKRTTFNYLPISSTSAATDAGASHLVMRNLESAMIISPCYSNGVGTVYFDAVNAETVNAANGYALVVEKVVGDVATNVISELDSSLWETVSLISLPVTGGAYPTEVPASVDEAVLSVATGGSDQNFYRICAPINERGLARFRIRRTKLASSYSSETLGRDSGGFILVDNILVSYPAMRADVEPMGAFDESLSGKEVVGQGGAWSVPFPSVSTGDVYGRARVKYTTNVATNATISEFVSSAKMLYRWRYLDQVTNDWSEVYLDAETFLSRSPLNLKAQGDEVLPGDIEFRYVLSLNAPYYNYVDYSGTQLGLGGLYTEEVSSVTNALDNASRLASRGTDWFVRLREGASDYASVWVGYAIDSVTNEQFVALDVIGSGLWRGFVPVSTNNAGKTFSYRFILRDKQTAGATEWAVNTNILYSANAATAFPISSVLTVGDTNSWSSFTLDGATGGYIFQIDETSKALTVAHADYQNFNGWTDATGPIFKGTSETNEYKVGTSSTKRYYEETFADWQAMTEVHDNWKFTESYVTNLADMASMYETFESATLGEWTVGPGMWVAKRYADAQSGVAVQMQGQGLGSVSYESTRYAPRGLKSVSFNARLGQFIDLDYFAHIRDGSTLSNYTYAAAGIFDVQSKDRFRGNASLSVVAYYQQYEGAYEARWEQIAENKQALSLYRWNCDSVSGASSSTLLKAWTNSPSWNPSPSNDTITRQPLMISVRTDKDATWIQVAARATPIRDGAGPTQFNVTGLPWSGFVYKDTSSERRWSGEYGIFSANCEANFRDMAYWSASTSMGNDSEAWTSGQLVFPGTAPEPISVTPMSGKSWALRGGSLVVSNNVVCASVAPQKLSIYTRSTSSGSWASTPIWTTNLNSFGAASFNVPLYTTENCQVQFRVESKLRDPRVDIVLDSVELSQWAGNSWGDTSIIDGHSRTDIPNYSSNGETNFVFTHAWIVTNKSFKSGILLSAKRTPVGGCASIRTPLMDGRNGRGLGLGMISFAYANAQTNANLRLEIATNNVSNASLDGFSGWTTVTNFSFTGMSALDRSGGRFNYYLGLHGVAGAWRLVVDTNTIANVASVQDTTAFGEVTITDIACYDEPALDSRSWWGWNLRMVSDSDDETISATNDNARIFLPDGAFNGQSLALNNSTRLDVDEKDAGNYPQNKPFVQTPTFLTNYIGEISFKARKYYYATNATLNAQPASVVLYGAKTGSSTQWQELHQFVISNETYAAFKYVTSPGEEYAAFRLAVSGADGVTNERGSIIPEDYDTAVRVLLDEVLVSEAVRPRMGFRNVGAFRSDLSTANWVKNVPSKEEQPLCDESWGVQCEVYGAQLMENIDFDREIQVKLYWYPRTSPWGFENWKTNSATRSAYLAEAADSNLVFRSSYETAPDAIVDPSTSFSVVQYALEVTWYQKPDATNPDASTILQTNILSAADWSTPSWYHPVDYNAQANSGFAAYTILDKVAPGWAWINEMNIYGGYSSYNNPDANAQFIELAVPAGADLQGWRLNLLRPQSSSRFVVTNTLAVFGSSGAPASKDLTYVQSNMTFIVVGSPLAQSNGYLSYDNGTLDAVWRVPSSATDVMGAQGEISSTTAFALQLVRASGIVEHELVAVGTNIWENMGQYEANYGPTNIVNQMNEYQPGSSYFYVGADDVLSPVSKPILDVTSSGYTGSGASLSVMYDRGETSNKWVKTARATPGRVNEGQEIDPDAIPTPNGESIAIYANLDVTLGHIRQRIGDAGDFTNASKILYMQKGSTRGTNITYEVDNWYELGSVTTNGAAIAVEELGSRQYRVNVGTGVSNNVTVVAAAQVTEQLRDLGLGADNPYSPAVIDWLEKGTDVYGTPWPNAGSGEINLAEFHSLNGTYVTNLTLTTMYWLDMDPTTNGLWLVGGMSQAPVEHQITSASTDNVLTNLRVGVKLYMTNTVTAKSWNPYVLRGIAPGSHSLDYATSTAWLNTNWTSATFKVTGFLNNGHGRISDYTCWVPLRWFAFTPDSFDADHQSFIEVTDPFSRSSPASSGGYGWLDWAVDHPEWEKSAFYFWSLDTRIKPVSVEPLKKENYYNWDETR